MPNSTQNPPTVESSVPPLPPSSHSLSAVDVHSNHQQRYAAELSSFQCIHRSSFSVHDGVIHHVACYLNISLKNTDTCRSESVGSLVTVTVPATFPSTVSESRSLSKPRTGAIAGGIVGAVLVALLGAVLESAMEKATVLQPLRHEDHPHRFTPDIQQRKPMHTSRFQLSMHLIFLLQALTVAKLKVRAQE
ncbi:hypothetical protein R3P38DRAFT_3273652 [Favolaschia claudopus]|uniref:Uncharacterized protein n=1 Tax=Favolaschia claudopus TaxID=2862362 RepID=A0AAW0B062_9AGAR